MTNQKQLFGARVLQPFAFSTRIRSPNVIGPYIISPPSFATYQLFSGNRYVIQILSPGILGIDEKPLLKEPLDEARARAIAASNPLPELTGG
ncbi:hypothetical protein M3Y99_01499200 [Aphelenchoides fujianensis]|nr:hypothetical protein M3Y99_01499200 [Aphelenchoides fujianensis]